MSDSSKPKKVKAPKPPKVPKQKAPPPSEGELVKKYANRVIKNQIYHGRVDAEKFQGMSHTHSVSKNLWIDSDFYFSVVFQSTEQKDEFLKAAKWQTDNADDQIQIINGLELAKKMGIKLKEETTKPFPGGNIELLPFVLDNENLKEASDG